jgi:hypothetical protein
VRIRQGRSLGIAIMLVFAIISFLISLYNFFIPYVPISYTSGAELVVVTTLTIAALSLLFYFILETSTSLERFCFLLFIICLLLGTLFAAYLLESHLLLIALFGVLIGWFIQVFTRRADHEIGY